MKVNLDRIARVVRLLIGAPLTISYFYARHLSGLWSHLLLALGLGFLASAIIGWSPLYRVLNRSREEHH